MGTRTSVYLSDDLIARWRASSLPMSEIFRRGLDAIEGTEGLEATLTRVIRRELAGVSFAADSPPARYERDGYSSEPYQEDP